MSDFATDFGWQRKFMPHLKRICGEHLISEAPPEEDIHHNTDLMVLNINSKRVACRIRRYEYFLKYPDEFTIRVSRPNGAKTELCKIIEGWGDYFLYGFSNADEDGLAAWILGSLPVFRVWFAMYPMRHGGEMAGIEKKNGDGSSGFRAFNVRRLPSDFIVARE